MRRRSAISLAALVTAGTLLVACGSDDDDSSAATTAAATTAAATAAPTTAAMAAMDIVDTAVAAGDFTTLATALTEAGLVETLKGTGPFTVFAPNDAAFAKVPKETLDKLLADKDSLTQVLTYHVVPGKVMAADVAAGPVMTVEGSEATIEVADGTVTIDGATVIATDIEASNGVIHVIDAVLLPPDLEI